MNKNETRRQLLKMIGYTSMCTITDSLTPWRIMENQQQMIQRIIPATGEKLPVVGLGSWLQFDVGSGQTERQPLLQVLKAMLAKGGKLIDSSPMYGQAEEVIGDLASSLPDQDKFFYATKVWTRGEENGIKQMQDSMQKMKRKTLDLMQVHNLTDYQTHLKTLHKWKSQGKVRYVGVTHYTESMHSQLEQVVKSKQVDFVQFNYSIRVRNAEKTLLNAAKDHGVAVIINEPFESGRLFSVVKGKPLPPWAVEMDIQSWAQYFLKFIISHTAVTCVIPGTSDPKHLTDNMAAGYGSLPDEKTRRKMADYINTF